jgi:glycosyltransferase involved in cell wall biosynthesis
MGKKISVITVVRNDKEGVRRTMQSVFEQTYSALEYLVIDGKSTDGTREEIEKNASRLDYFLSEADTGVYDAMNKGIRSATGDYVLFLNAGDYFHAPGSLQALEAGAGTEDFIYGDILYKSPDKEVLIASPDTLTFDFFVRNTLPHPCTLIRRGLFESVGYYDPSIRICADWAFFLISVAKHGARYKHVSVPVTIFMLGGLSSNEETVKREKEKVLREEFNLFYEEHLRLKEYERRFQSLRKSKWVSWTAALWPGKIRNILYK